MFYFFLLLAKLFDPWYFETVKSNYYCSYCWLDSISIMLIMRMYFVWQEFERPLSWRKSGTWACKPCSHKIHVSNCLLPICVIYCRFAATSLIISVSNFQMSNSIVMTLLQNFAKQFFLWNHPWRNCTLEWIGGFGFGLQQL